MAPGATIGAATPVNFLGEKAPEKVISYWRAEMRATAEKNKRPVQIADAMVDEAVEIPGLIERGKLLTLTSNEALKYEIADYKAEDIAEVLKTIGISGAKVIHGSKRMGNMKELLKPYLVWFIVGFIFLLLEFVIPGLITVFLRDQRMDSGNIMSIFRNFIQHTIIHFRVFFCFAVGVLTKMVQDFIRGNR